MGNLFLYLKEGEVSNRSSAPGTGHTPEKAHSKPHSEPGAFATAVSRGV